MVKECLNAGLQDILRSISEEQEKHDTPCFDGGKFVSVFSLKLDNQKLQRKE